MIPRVAKVALEDLQFPDATLPPLKFQTRDKTIVGPFYHPNGIFNTDKTAFDFKISTWGASQYKDVVLPV